MTNEVKFLITTVIVTVGVLIGGAYYFTKSGPTTSGTVAMTDVLKDDMYSIGSPSAQIKIAEFADFQCPACAASEPTLKEVLKEYGDKVYFEYHHFPLAIHNWSILAAEAAEAAGAQGKFQEYHDVLFAKQTEWSANKDATTLFKQYAKDLGLDTTKFNDELDKHTYKDKVLASYSHGSSLNVQSTPTFFVNGQKIEGGLRKEEWKTLLDAELQKK